MRIKPQNIGKSAAWIAVGLILWVWSEQGGKFNTGQLLMPFYLLAVVIKGIWMASDVLHRI